MAEKRRAGDRVTATVNKREREKMREREREREKEKEQERKREQEKHTLSRLIYLTAISPAHTPVECVYMFSRTGGQGGVERGGGRRWRRKVLTKL